MILSQIFSRGRWFFLLILIASAGSGCSAVDKLFGAGDILLTLRIESSGEDKQEALRKAIDVTAKKVKAIGYECETATIGNFDDTFSVRIYNAKDAHRAKQLILSNPFLELRKAISPPFPSELKSFSSSGAARKAAETDQEIMPYDNDGRDEYLLLEKKQIITGEDISEASAFESPGYDGDYTISFNLKPEGAKKMADWTGRNIHSYIAIIIDRKVLSAAYIKSQITDSAQIDGRFTKEDADNLALSLNLGHIPGKLILLEESVIK